MLNMSATIDPVRRLYLCAGNGGFYKVSLNAPYTATQLNGSNCGSLGSISAPGFTYDPVQNRIVGWTGGNTAYIYNPDTDSCTAQTYSGGPTTIQGNGTDGRFAYSPALGVFVVANSVDTKDRKSTRLNSSHLVISYAVFCLKKKKKYYIYLVLLLY